MRTFVIDVHPAYLRQRSLRPSVSTCTIKRRLPAQPKALNQELPSRIAEKDLATARNDCLREMISDSSRGRRKMVPSRIRAAVYTTSQYSSEAVGRECISFEAVCPALRSREVDG